ncbi:MAG TPA: methyltransferase domain-containing protein [Syntrophales bacterium]|nr:methyltransferase domain-containing protein [Syntrophales bacterium]HPQ44094.1 methyltransferase domain-containing protein [Syntrophales bacterium]
MESVNRCRLYEQEKTFQITGETIRPGGFELTRRIVGLCQFQPQMLILDVGCGMGATAQYLHTRHQLKSVGIDASHFLISRGRESNPLPPLMVGCGESLPFKDATADGILMECSLSVMNDADMVLSECRRVLKTNGWLAITDLYCKEPGRTQSHETSLIQSCLQGAQSPENILGTIVRHGFHVTLWEDQTALLRQFIIDIIWNHGSLNHFWSDKITGTCNGSDRKGMKPGYFLCIARKHPAEENTPKEVTF